MTMGRFTGLAVVLGIFAPANVEHPGVNLAHWIQGVACTPETHVSREVGQDGRPYISASGKALCEQVGPGSVTVVLILGSRELARKTVESNETSSIAAVSVPCVDGPATGTWLVVAQYNDEYIGQTIQHNTLDDSHCTVG